MVVGLEPENEGGLGLGLVEQVVGLVHGHEEAPGNALLRAIAEAGLIAGVGRQGPAIGAGLVGGHASLGGDEGCMLHHREVVGIGRVVLHPNLEPRNLVEGVVVLPADIRPVDGIGVDIHVVAVVDAQVLGRLRVHVDLPLADSGRAFVLAVGVAEIVAQDEIPIGHRPLGMDRMARLGRGAEEAVALSPQRVLSLLHLGPGHLVVGDGANVRVLHLLQKHLGGEAVVPGADVRVARDDDVGQVGRRLGRLAVNDEILAMLDGLGDVAVGVQPAAVGGERSALVDLLPEGGPRVGSEQHQRAAGHAVLPRHDVLDRIAVHGRGGVHQPVNIDLLFSFEGELPVVGETLVIEELGQLLRHPRHDAKIVPVVVKRFDSVPSPDLEKRVGAGIRDLKGLELDPAVRRQNEIGVLARCGHLDLLGDDHVDLGIDVLDQVVGPLGVVDQVDVGGPDHLGGRGEMGLAGEHLAAIFGRIDDEDTVAVGPIADFLTAGMGVDMLFGDALIGVEKGVERILGHPTLEARARPFGALEVGRLIVARPGVTAAARDADAADQHQRQVGGAVVQRGVEVVVDALAIVDRDGIGFPGLAHEVGIPEAAPEILGQPLDQFLWRATDFVDGIEVVVPEMHLVHLPQGHHLDLGAVYQGHLAGPRQGGVQSLGGKLVPNVLPGDGLEFARAQVVDDEVADAFALLCRQSLDREAVSLGNVLILISREHVLGPQAFQGVGTHQQREVCELLDERLVIPTPVHENLRNPKEDGGVRQTRTNRHPVVRLGGGRVVFGSDDHDPGAAFHDFVEPVRFGHFVFDQILAHLHGELGEADVVEVDIRGLKPVHKGMSGGLVAVPCVVRPVAAAQRLVAAHSADMAVEERHHVAEAVESIFADDTQEAHAAPELHRPGAGPAPILKHLRLVAVLVEQAPLALVTAIGRGDGLQPLRQVSVDFIPGEADEFVAAAGVELVATPQFRFVGQGREAVIGPPFPSLSDHRVLQTVRSVHPPVEGVTLEAHAGVPGAGRLVAVEVLVVLVLVGLLDPGHDAVAHEGPDSAGVGVIG